MDPIMTNEEFQNAWSNLSFHYAPEGYWEEVNRQRKQHRFVGRKALIDGKAYLCTMASDDQVIFQFGPVTELIINGDNVNRIKWL